jgi:predicted aspartyl protease
MGMIVTRLTITNRLDEGRAASGDIAASAVRSITLDNVLADTGATMLCLPRSAIEHLGLALLREATVATATGSPEGSPRARIFQDAKISLLGREGTFECLELLGGTTPFLGVIPLEALGIELDLRTQQLRLLPEDPTDTYISVM